MHIERWFCSSCLAGGTLGGDPDLRKVCTDIDKEWKNCTDIMYRNQDADLRKVCTKILCKVQGATQVQPHPSLPWPVASEWEQLIRPLLAFWSFAGFVHTVTRGIYAHPALWDESVPSNRAGSSPAESFGTLSTTHTRHTHIQKQSHLIVCLLPTNWRFNLWQSLNGKCCQE